MPGQHKHHRRGHVVHINSAPGSFPSVRPGDGCTRELCARRQRLPSPSPSLPSARRLGIARPEQRPGCQSRVCDGLTNGETRRRSKHRQRAKTTSAAAAGLAGLDCLAGNARGWRGAAARLLLAGPKGGCSFDAALKRSTHQLRRAVG
jgi:hypothetical protein